MAPTSATLAPPPPAVPLEYRHRRPAPAWRDLGELVQVAEVPYEAECPVGGHDASWIGRLWAHTATPGPSDVVVDCRVCPETAPGRDTSPAGSV